MKTEAKDYRLTMSVEIDRITAKFRALLVYKLKATLNLADGLLRRHGCMILVREASLENS